jgi:hypothetical protein
LAPTLLRFSFEGHFWSMEAISACKAHAFARSQGTFSNVTLIMTLIMD